MKRRTEYHRNLVIWNKNKRKIKHIIDKRCSENPTQDRKEIIDAVLWHVGMKGVRLKPYNYYKIGKNYKKMIKKIQSFLKENEKKVTI